MKWRSVRNALSAIATFVAVVTFGSLLLVLPWLFGGVETWVRAGAAIALAVVVAAVFVHASTATMGDTVRARLWVALPFAGLIGLAALQLAGGLVTAESIGRFNSPHTIYPAETRLALASLIAVSAAALAGATIFSREGAFHCLLGVILASAAMVAFGGIAMRLTGDDRVVRGVTTIGEPFARFINRNNAAAFLQLGIASGLALLRSVSRPDPLEEEATFLARGWKTLDRSTLVIIVTALLALCLAGVVVTQSRGGLLAAACTMSVAVPFFSWRRHSSRLAVLAAPLAVAAGLLLWVGLSTETVERLESTTLDEVLTTGRVPHWRDAWHAVEARPLFGAGLGPYGYAYQEFSRRDYEGWFEHADNQLLELLVETGVVGGGVLLAVWAFSVFGLVRGSRLPVERILVATVVVGQSVHAIFDYGILVPATALAATAAWSAGMTRLTDRSRVTSTLSTWWTPLSWGGCAVVCAVLGGGLYWSTVEFQSAWSVDRHLKLSRELDRPESVDTAELEAAISGLTTALEQRPDDAVGHQVLAEYFVHRYRAAAAERVQEAEPGTPASEAWRLTQLSSLHRMVNLLIRSGSTTGLNGLRYNPMVQESLRPAHQHYQAAAEHCPRLPGVWIPLASLAFLDPEADAGGTSYLETAIRLFPANPELLKTAGRIAWQAGDSSLAGRCWRQSFQLWPGDYWDFASRLADEAGLDEAMKLTCPENWQAIFQVATNVPADARVDMQRLVGQRLEAAVADAPESWEKEHALAAVDRLTGDWASAEDRLRRLVAARPEEAEVHKDLALVLANLGKMTEARGEAAVAAALDARYVAFRQQIESYVRKQLSSQ